MKTKSFLSALLLVAGVAFAPPSAWALRVDGMDFPDTLRVAGRELQLNGVGFRAVATIKGYAAALYVTQRGDTAAQVAAANGPKRLELRLLLDVPSIEFSKAFRKGAERNTPPADWPAIAPRAQAFDKQVQALGQLRKGDVINLDFVPGKGLAMAVNGQPRGEPVPGEDLYAALLRVFVGERVSDEKLKRGLLGAPT